MYQYTQPGARRIWRVWLLRSAEELGLRVLDHLVVTYGSHFSFQEAGFL